MKKTAAIFLLLLPLLLLGLPGSVRPHLTIMWDHSPSWDGASEMWYRVYSSTNLNAAKTNWLLVETVAAPTNYIKIYPEGRLRWFVATASNVWGESDFSEALGIPQVPSGSGRLGIRFDP